MRPLIAFMIVLAFAAPVSALECQNPQDSFRLELDVWIAELHEASEVAGQIGYPAAADFQGAVVELDAVLSGLSEDELTELCEIFADSPSVLASPRAAIDGMLLAGVMGESSGADCNDLAHWALFGLASLADIGLIVTHAGCEYTGCKGELWKAACNWWCGIELALDFVASALHYAVDGVDRFCFLNHTNQLDHVDEGMPGVNADVLANQQILSRDANAELSALAAQGAVDDVASTVAELDATVSHASDGNVASELAAIATEAENQGEDRRAFQELNLRLMIEKYLRSGESGRIATFQLPESVGGRLELVREVVASTITMHLEAGKNVNDALWKFQLADYYLNTRRYKRAFTQYRLAYQQAERGRPGLDR